MLPLPFDPIIADAYRQAALAGQDMYVFAGQMERLKAALTAAEDLYQQWERLDNLAGEALWSKQEAQHLLLVRNLFFEALESHFTQVILQPDATPEQDWSRWWAAFSEASFHWQTEALLALCQTLAFERRFGKKLNRYSRFIDYFRDRRWVETREVFWELAGDKTLPDEHRGYHHYVCGQIDLYFHYRYQEAKELFAEAEKLLSGKPLAFHGWVEYYLKSAEKDHSRAAGFVEQALKLDAGHAPTLILKADVLAEKGLLTDAEDVYLQSRQIRPGNATAYTRLLDLYGKPDFFEKKLTEIEALVALDARLESATAYLVWTDAGAIYQQHGETNWSKAEAYHRKACDAFPRGITPVLNLGYFYLDTLKYSEAESCFQKVVQLAPEAREGYLALARLCEAREAWEAARSHYEQVKKLIPSWERFMLSSTGRCLRRLERWEEAEADLLAAWALDEYDDSGSMTEVYEMVQQLYKHPDNPQPDKAVQILDRAAQKRRGTPAIAAGMANRQGHALFYVERYAEALPFYRHAAELMPEEPVYYTNQADCYDKLYRQAKEEQHFRDALESLDKAAKLAPQDSSIPKKRRQLSLVRYNPHLAELPALYQVHVEVGHPLLDEITLDYQSLLPGITALTDALRLRMRERYAINLPGLRYRDISETAGAFQFRLYETPVWRDHLPATQENPPTMAAVLEQLELFIKQYCLDLFVNYWDVDKEVPLLPNTELVHFTRVVMAMLVEQIPLPPLPQLHQLYRAEGGANLPIAEVVEKLRMTEALRPHLPGAGEAHVFSRLGAHEEQVFRACLIGQGNNRALALPLPFAQGFLGAVVRMAEAHPNLTLITQNNDLRPFLRSVLAGLPRVAILKTPELPADAGTRSLEPLEIREQDSQALLDALR